ncbi:MAG TPA: methyltransferase domain-containing protein [Tepidisphaeraceae bacterium]|nr:methyltransferase domain-containing protein [Tepidisphaeraceae bacterium]
MAKYRPIPEYYDAEYEQEEMLERDVPFLLKHLRPRQSVLELAVGTGRAAIPIAQAGHRVVGIDNDAAMLRVAAGKREAVGLKEKRLKLLNQDILDLKIGQKFDWICVLFNTFLIFTTLEQQDRALRAIRRHLKASGRFWVDIFQPNLALIAQDESTNLQPKTFYVPQLDRTVFRSTDVRRDPASQIQRVTFHYIWFDKAGRQMHQERTFNLTFLFPRELRLLLERNGLEIEELYGNYDGSKLNANSPRMIALCKRL